MDANRLHAKLDTFIKEAYAELLFLAKPFHVEHWQSQKVEDDPNRYMRELLNVRLNYRLPLDAMELAANTGANLPWAEDHFQERVGGEPLNPAPSEAWWPYAQQGNAAHKQNEVFAHTYPERMWPRFAGEAYAEMASSHSVAWEPMQGIRFAYGDLEDVVQQLKKDPTTRQAYLPLWFPEDTGSTSGQRVPCTLGYHFLLRDGKLQITYYIRSCDIIRHFRDDVYMAGRLCQWMCMRFNEDAPLTEMIEPGLMIMDIVNLHCFGGDVPKMNYELNQFNTEYSTQLMMNL